MLGAMNFWIGIVLYDVNKPSNLNENIQTKKLNKQNTSAPNNNNSNKDPKKRSARKFSDTIQHARFPGGKQEVAKTFIGEKPNSIVINQLAEGGTKITDKDLCSLLNGPKHVFKEITDHKKVLATLRNLGKQNSTFSGIYI
jgi:hypothetical protein